MQGVRFEPSIALLQVDFFGATPSVETEKRPSGKDQPVKSHELTCALTRRLIPAEDSSGYAGLLDHSWFCSN